MGKREISVGIIATTTLIAGLAGCSNNKSNTGSSPPPAEKVVVDGQTQNISGPVSCTPLDANVSISIGDPTNGVGAVITTVNPPAVQSVGLGNVNGVTLGYSAAAPNPGNVQVTKSGNSYTIKGTATGVNLSSPQQPVTKTFEMDMTCP